MAKASHQGVLWVNVWLLFLIAFFSALLVEPIHSMAAPTPFESGVPPEQADPEPAEEPLLEAVNRVIQSAPHLFSSVQFDPEQVTNLHQLQMLSIVADPSVSWRDRYKIRVRDIGMIRYYDSESKFTYDDVIQPLLENLPKINNPYIPNAFRASIRDLGPAHINWKALMSIEHPHQLAVFLMFCRCETHDFLNLVTKFTPLQVEGLRILIDRPGILRNLEFLLGIESEHQIDQIRRFTVWRPKHMDIRHVQYGVTELQALYFAALARLYGDRPEARWLQLDAIDHLPLIQSEHLARFMIVAQLPIYTMVHNQVWILSHIWNEAQVEAAEALSKARIPVWPYLHELAKVKTLAQAQWIAEAVKSHGKRYVGRWVGRKHPVFKSDLWRKQVSLGLCGDALKSSDR